MPPCLTLSIIRYGSRVKWSNPGKGVAPSPTPWCSKLSKREPSGHPRLWSPTFYISVCLCVCVCVAGVKRIFRFLFWSILSVSVILPGTTRLKWRVFKKSSHLKMKERPYWMNDAADNQMKRNFKGCNKVGHVSNFPSFFFPFFLIFFSFCFLSSNT